MSRLIPLLFLALAAAPSSAAPRPPLSDAELRQGEITLERTGCYGECPIYKVRISGSGLVRFDGEHFVKASGRHTARVRPAAVRELVAAFEKAGWFRIRRDFSQNTCSKQCRKGCVTDSPSVITSLTLRGRTHQIRNYHGCLCSPRILWELERKVDEAAGTDRWVGKRQGQRASSGP